MHSAASGDIDSQCTGDDDPQLLSLCDKGLFPYDRSGTGFRIAEEGELKLLKHDVMEELLERYYEEGMEFFRNL